MNDSQPVGLTRSISRGKLWVRIRRSAVSRSATTFWEPTSEIARAAPAA